MTFQLNNEEATLNICKTMRQSGELQSVSVIFHKEKMKKDNEQKCEKREFMVAMASGEAEVQTYKPLLDYPSNPSWSS